MSAALSLTHDISMLHCQIRALNSLQLFRYKNRGSAPMPIDMARARYNSRDECKTIRMRNGDTWAVYRSRFIFTWITFCTRNTDRNAFAKATKRRFRQENTYIRPAARWNEFLSDLFLISRHMQINRR